MAAFDELETAGVSARRAKEAAKPLGERIAMIEGR